MINKFAHFYIQMKEVSNVITLILRMSLNRSGPATSSQISMNVTCLCDNPSISLSYTSVYSNRTQCLSMNACYADHNINWVIHNLVRVAICLNRSKSPPLIAMNNGTRPNNLLNYCD